MNIACNNNYIAINYGISSTFTNIQLLPIDYNIYKINNNPYILKCHGDNLGDMLFSPYNNILITGSKDCTIKLWSLPENNQLLNENINQPLLCINNFESGITNIKYHPSSNNILACTTSKNNIALIDLEAGKINNNFNLGENTSALSCAWNTNGSRLAVISKDGTISLVFYNLYLSQINIRLILEIHQVLKSSVVVILNHLIFLILLLPHIIHLTMILNNG